MCLTARGTDSFARGGGTMDTAMCLTSTSSVRGRSKSTMGTATPQSLKTKAPTGPRSSSDCSKTCKAVMAALTVPQEG